MILVCRVLKLSRWHHPLTLMSNEICDTFIGLGYTIAEGPDVELDLFNFEMLRLPKGHPARRTRYVLS